MKNPPPMTMSFSLEISLLILLLLALIGASVQYIRLTPLCRNTITSIQHKIHIVQTHHVRYHPVRHAFKYPLFYFRVKLGEDFNVPWWLAGWERGLFAVREGDYLGGGDGRKQGFGLGLKQRVLELLASMGISTSDIGSIELVTTPRVLGYAFNPLSVYFCYSSTTPSNVHAVILEVNNTFGERHVYVCCEKNRVKSAPGYDYSHSIDRSFHVSPFNNRSGNYEAHFKHPDKTLDVLLNIKNYTDASLAGLSKPLWFTARVWGDAYALDARTCAYLLVTYPVTAFLTFPRILRQAWILAYRKRMKIYQRPSPMRVPKDGRGMVWKRLNNFQTFCRRTVFDHFHIQAEGHSTSLIVYEQGRPSYTTLHGGAGSPPIKVHVTSPAFYTTLVLEGDDVGRGLGHSFVRGDWTCTKGDLERFLGMLLSKEGNREGRQPMSAEPRECPKTKKVISPFSYPGFAHMHQPSRPQRLSIRWKLWMGSLSIRLEQSLFILVANFTIDPYSVEERIFAYAMDEQAEKVAHSVEPASDNSESTLIGEIDDGADIQRKELDRFQALATAFRKSVGSAITVN
ncbi:uncharacterized protein SPPG_01859 [Spizellomyces punctatus DAOM BR117]|uniref:Cyclopropane-fatty-acyl-phospholipid synthase n=1 Tax=Spizellomyces punctatus (strain DAOM BR117) TaxID=645134 RepID=A0A0L0HNZ5_SPIPD|nr:uncharacterized protein SPPG_01859 [Spizellomyces punctatus DAOM BR117]KND02778.1 hypothetical protein SPPG_01859 [Spizellomyces punctatus DAOM BR117]|eukprot:XP_016610817.1 hypothetical protein SPPG_01859 [Spizellomyces punctatus DAOM BR117]